MSSQKTELEKINDHIKKLFNEWKALQPLKPKDQEMFDKKVRLDWNYHSNKIEGNTLTYSETKALLDEGEEEGIHPPRDYKEMKAHDLAINKIKELAKNKEKKLNEVTIRDLNQIILKEPFWKDAVTTDGQKTKKKIFPGKYKKQPNHVITEEGKPYKFAEPHDVPIKMQELIDWFHKEMEHPTLSIASFLAKLHHRFIVIHPFDDGNGRVTRLWINYVLLKLGYPPLAIKSEDKRNYFAALQRADTGDMDAFAIYLGKALISWLEIGIKAAKGEDISEVDDIDKEVDLFVRERTGKRSDKYLSKEFAINLVDSLDTLFKSFKNKFEQFNRLFDRQETKQYLELVPSNENHRFSFNDYRKEFKNKEDIKKELGLLKYQNIPLLLFDFIEEDSEDLKYQCSEDDSLPGLLEKVALNVLGYPNLYRLTDLLPYIWICIDLSYCTYYDDSQTLPLNMKAHLSVNMNKTKYKTRLIIYKEEDNKDDSSRERYYHQLLTQEEASKFVAKGKEEFLKLLEKAVGKDTDDKK